MAALLPALAGGGGANLGGGGGAKLRSTVAAGAVASELVSVVSTAFDGGTGSENRGTGALAACDEF